MKKSKGLVQNFIDAMKFAMAFQNNPEASKLLIKHATKMNKGGVEAKKIHIKEVRSPSDDLKHAPAEFWDEVIENAKSLGIGLIGFAPVEENLIFKEDKINRIKNTSLYDNAIVLGMEMDFDAIDTAPELTAGLEALRIYAELGDATNKLADFVRSKGYNAIACHPLGGPILYPPMAVKANLGEMGRNGLLITKEYGPRQRLSLISTNASPLPKQNPVDFKIADYCKNCGICIRECPTEATLEEPITNENGNISRIDSDKCFPYFYEKTGCSVCIKVCPFHRLGYEKVIREK
jgi:ferredoxin